MPAVTVVVPTLNESGNLEPLITRLAAAFGSRSDWEILLVDDDSTDGTAELAARLAASHPVRILVRKGERGLASAVLKGIGASEAPVVVVMDADLSHPPETAPRLAEAVEGGADVAIGSRYVEGGGTENWPLVRKLMSKAATGMARGLTSASDPMAGFFALRRSLLDGVDLRVKGFKILLEILARARPSRVAEIPIRFADRHAGQSKLGAGVTTDYVLQLLRLYAARPAVQVLAMIGAVTLLKAAIAGLAPLQSIEAYHWMYAKHPALGYFDHPAMIGWWGWLSTALLGDGRIGVRAIPLAAGALGAWWVFLAGRKLADERAGRLAAALYLLVPMTFMYSASATPDAPALLFWAGTLWTLSHALFGGRPAWWLAAGLFVGAAMLSKYHAVFLAGGVSLFLLASSEARGWLRRPWPWVAGLLALAVFSPTLVWNARHGWPSLAYQGVERFRESKGFEPGEAPMYLIKQLAWATPFVAAWMWVGGIGILARWKASRPQDRLLACLSMPLLFFFVLLALVRTVRPHWAAPAYAPGVVLAATAALGSLWGRRLLVGSAAVLAVATAAAVPAAAVKVEDSWAHLATRLAGERYDFVLARDYHDAAQLAYHLRPAPACDFTAVGRDHKAFPWWWNAAEHAGRDAIVVWEKKDWPDKLELVKARFEGVSEPVEVTVPRTLEKPATFVVVRAMGYR